jgi:Amiloride-sensitive sodium channel
MLHFVIESIKNYFEYPTQTSVKIAIEWPVPFPAFTFCNICPLRFDRFIGPFLNYTNSLKLTNSNDTSSFTFQQSKYIRDFLQMKIHENQSLDDYFYSLDSMMMYCSSNGIHCSSSDFLSFRSSSYGRCYTFNAKRKNLGNESTRGSNLGGGVGSLSLRLYAHSHQYVPYISDGKLINYFDIKERK